VIITTLREQHKENLQTFLKDQVRVIFRLECPPNSGQNLALRKAHGLSPHPPPTLCPDRGTYRRKMRMEHWCNGSDMVKTDELKEKTVQVPNF